MLEALSKKSHPATSTFSGSPLQTVSRSVRENDWIFLEVAFCGDIKQKVAILVRAWHWIRTPICGSQISGSGPSSSPIIRAMVPKLWASKGFGLQLPEAPTSLANSQEFWELKSSTAGGLEFRDHCIRGRRRILRVQHLHKTIIYLLVSPSILGCSL